VIASVSGTVIDRGAAHVVIEAGGVGYMLNVSANTLDAVPASGASATLHATLVVREDAMQLYGFAGVAERDLFGLLTGVSGVGPKVALAVLSGMTVAEAEGALVAGDHARFQEVPGIGRRTAERLVVELKDKVVPSGVPEASRGVAAGESPRDLARDGLLGLGYSAADADAMVAAAEGETAEALIASALRGVAA
jgi:Holliday junction DNA helicase RuvA